MTRGYPLLFVGVLAGSMAVASSVEGQASEGVAVSGVVCIDEDRDGECGPIDPLIGQQRVELLSPDGDVVAVGRTEGDPPRYEFAGLPTLPSGERYRVQVRDPDPTSALVLATAGGVPVEDPEVGTAVARELPNDGDRDDTLDFTFLRVPFGDAGIELYWTRTSTPTFWFEDFTFAFAVANSGTEPLTEVNATVYNEAGLPYALIIEDVSGPDLSVGNGDDVLDVGEQWVYEGVAPAAPLAVAVTAQRSDASRVTVTDYTGVRPFPGALRPPIEVVSDVDCPTVMASEPRPWTIVVSNRIDKDLIPGDARGEFGRHRLLYPDWAEPIPYTPLGAPVDKGEGDDVLAPGESWQWQVEHVVDIDGSYLDIEVYLRVPGEEPDATVGFRSTICGPALPTPPPLAPSQPLPPPPTTPAPTTTTATSEPGGETLPETGLGSTVAVLALAICSGGAVLMTVTRARIRPRG